MLLLISNLGLRPLLMAAISNVPVDSAWRGGTRVSTSGVGGAVLALRLKGTTETHN